MARIIIDITELAQWQGKPTGVPRVMDEIAGRFAKDPACVFVVWDGSVKGYREIDFAAIQNRESGEAQPVLAGSSSQKTSRMITAAKRLKQKSRIASKALVIPEKVARKLLASKPAPKGDSVPLVEPQKGDTLLVMADWHGSDENFVRYIINQQNKGVKLVQMTYDLLPIVTPQYSGHATASLTNYTKRIYPVCDVILAISQHTKKDIIAWLNKNKLKAPRIEVIRLGDDFKRAKPSKPANKYFASNKKFILCVGTIEARKNHTLLYYVYKLANQKNIELPDLVVVGRRGWKSDDIYEIITTDPITKEKFIMLEKCNDEELSWLYQNCLFSIYPSFYEGWGLPIAESISYGTPCICSNTSSMPEVAGKLLEYFSPFSTDECLQAITVMLKPGAINSAKRKIESYGPTSWDQSFGSVKQIIGEIHAKNN